MWIKLSTALRGDPRVALAAEALSCGRAQVIGYLHGLWSWWATHSLGSRTTSTSHVRAGLLDIVEAPHTSGQAIAALSAPDVGLLNVEGDSCSLAGYEEWIGPLAAKRERDAERAKESRERRRDVAAESQRRSPESRVEQSRVEQKREEKKGGGAHAPPPKPTPCAPTSSGGNGDGGMLQEVQGVLERNGVGGEPEEPTHRPPSPPASVQHLLGVARKVCRMPGKTDTLLSYLEAAAARHGASKVEQWLYDAHNKGSSIIAMTDALEKLKRKDDRIF